ncbi:MAG: twin-arginine translocation signal domain-containing protein, partial [Candidatus Binatia bacterium]
MANDIVKKKHVLTRRKFLQYSAGASALLGAGSLLGLAGSGEAASAKGKGPKKKRITKSRTYIFNLSHLDSSKHDIILVAGKQRVKLNQTNPSVFKKAVKEHPIFRHVPEMHMTHHVTLDMPEDAIQLCYLQKKARGKKTGHWTMAHMFYHLPESALLHARKRHLTQMADGLPKVHVKWQRYGLTPRMIAAFHDPIGEAMLQDTNDQATAMVAGHPELASGEPNSAAHIQNNIIGTQ